MNGGKWPELSPSGKGKPLELAIHVGEALFVSVIFVGYMTVLIQRIRMMCVSFDTYHFDSVKRYLIFVFR